jgi:hypothetical protein
MFYAFIYIIYIIKHIDWIETIKVESTNTSKEVFKNEKVQ